MKAPILLIAASMLVGCSIQDSALDPDASGIGISSSATQAHLQSSSQEQQPSSSSESSLSSMEPSSSVNVSSSLSSSSSSQTPFSSAATLYTPTAVARLYPDSGSDTKMRIVFASPYDCSHDTVLYADSLAGIIIPSNDTLGFCTSSTTFYLRVTIEAEGYYTILSGGVQPGDTILPSYQMWEPGNGFFGTLTDDYGCGDVTPIPYKEVSLKFPDGSFRIITTDSAGQFHVLDAPSWNYWARWYYAINGYTVSGFDTVYYRGGRKRADIGSVIQSYSMPDGAPYIYLYPEERTQVDVKLSLPSGSQILASTPEYGNGWNVSVQPDGMIDGHYPFLYYETSVQPQLQRDSGWVLDGSNLSSGFSSILRKSGFQGREISDFLDYWIPRLPTSPYYLVYPQDPEIVSLQISPKPDILHRVSWFVLPMDYPVSLREPHITVPVRQGFVAVEWGVMIPWRYFQP